jgi:hypothetical protein
MVISRNAAIYRTPGRFALGYKSGFKVKYFLFSQIGSRHIRRRMGFLIEKVKYEKALVLFMVPNLRERCAWARRWVTGRPVACYWKRITQYHAVVKLT